jgi:eukaryotic-like serine/threonine-protein kinase
VTLRIDRYQVERLIGQGAMGKVYLAQDPKLGRQVAIKVLAQAAADDNVRQRFRLEARAIAALKHPNIVELYDYSGEQAEDLFLVMEYIPGASLDQLQRQHGNMSEPTVVCIAHELCLALVHAHGHQVVHRDLKPENVLLSQGRVVLTDFGVVKALAKSSALGISRVRTRTQVLGTPGFMAPEQFNGRQIDHRTDIFSLGAVMYCLATGKLPYEGGSVDEIYNNLKHGRFKDPREHHKLLSPGFAELVANCLNPKIKDRIQNAEELRTEIIALLGSHGVSEIRHELSLYERSPATYAIEQRQRSVDVLLRDLKVALKDKDEDMAEHIVRWVQNLAPLDQRMLDMTGIKMDPRQRRAVITSEGRRTRWGTIYGLVGGAALGVVLSVVFDLRAFVPDSWLRSAEAVVQWFAPHGS